MRQERNRSKEVMKIGLDNHGKSTSTYKGGASCKFWMGRIPDSFLNVTSINTNWGLFCMERTKEQCRVSIGRKTYGSLANVNVIDCNVCLSMYDMALSFFAVTITLTYSYINVKINLRELYFRMMSAIGMLGTPAEIYRYGSQFGAILLSFPLVMYSVTYWYLPVFWKIEVSTSYEVGIFSYLLIWNELIE